MNNERINHTQVARYFALRVNVLCGETCKGVDQEDRVDNRVSVEGKASDQDQHRRFERDRLCVPSIIYHEHRRQVDKTNKYDYCSRDSPYKVIGDEIAFLAIVIG